MSTFQGPPKRSAGSLGISITRLAAQGRYGVDEMLGQCLHSPVGTGRATVLIVVADPLEMVYDDQCLFGTGEFVHRVS
jgi:hypothetical protein